MLPNTLSLLCYFTPYRSYPFGKIVLKGLGEVKVFPRGSTVKNPPAMQKTQEMQVQSLNPEDPLEEGMATHFSIHAWRILWTEEAGSLQSWGHMELNTTEAT